MQATSLATASVEAGEQVGEHAFGARSVIGGRLGDLACAQGAVVGDKPRYPIAAEVPAGAHVVSHAVSVSTPGGAGAEDLLPEGHVIHRLAQASERWFGGRPVAVSSPQGRFASSAALLDGAVLDAAEAYGKHLYLDFAAATPDHLVHIHLGLIGGLTFGPPRPVVGQVRMRLANVDQVADLVGPQECRLVTDDERAAQVARLGADPLRDDADPDHAWDKIRRSGRSIAALLMDQQVAAGVGNIFRAEVLFRHRVNPVTPGSRLSRATWDVIWADLVELMHYAVDAGRIDTVYPEHTPEQMGRPPRVDRHGGEVYVYRRAGLPCLVCGTLVKTKLLDNRNLYWCSRCQRRR